MIRPVMTYEQNVSLSENNTCKISVEKRMFKWIWGKNRKYRIKNELIRKHLGVSSIDDKLRDSFEMIWTCQTPT